MTTFQPGDRVRITIETYDRGGIRHPAGRLGVVRQVRKDMADVVWYGTDHAANIMLMADLALEVNGL